MVNWLYKYMSYKAYPFGGTHLRWVTELLFYRRLLVDRLEGNLAHTRSSIKRNECKIKALTNILNKMQLENPDISLDFETPAQDSFDAGIYSD